MSLNIGLIGTGRMGQEISRLAPRKGHRIIATFDRSRPLSREALRQDIDVFIDFSHPGVVIDHVRTLAGGREVALVIGTTGWYEQLDEIMNLALASGMSVVYAPNFSVGVSAFLRIVQAAGRLFDELDDYDLFVHETHHRGKVDSPSGTALALADILMKAVQRKSELRTDDAPGPVAPQQLQVTSSRGGSMPGIHSVFFDSVSDTIELKHVARNRSGFVLGALLAAEWIQENKGFFTLDDVLENVFLQSTRREPGEEK